MSDLPATAIQFSPATVYKQSQKTSTSHSVFQIPWCVFFQLLLSHVPLNSIDPAFGHFTITVWPSFRYHLSAIAQVPPCIQHLDHPSLQYQTILILFSGICWPISSCAQVTKPTTACQYLYSLLKKESVHLKTTPWERASYCILY